jgi:hypothetical protein
MPGLPISAGAVLAVLHRAYLEVADDPRAQAHAHAPHLSAAHIAHALTLPSDASLLKMPAAPGCTPSIASRIELVLVGLKHERLVTRERRVLGRVVQDVWAITLEGMARARRDAAA